MKIALIISRNHLIRHLVTDFAKKINGKCRKVNRRGRGELNEKALYRAGGSGTMGKNRPRRGWNRERTEGGPKAMEDIEDRCANQEALIDRRCMWRRLLLGVSFATALRDAVGNGIRIHSRTISIVVLSSSRRRALELAVTNAINFIQNQKRRYERERSGNGATVGQNGLLRKVESIAHGKEREVQFYGLRTTCGGAILSKYPKTITEKEVFKKGSRLSLA